MPTCFVRNIFNRHFLQWHKHDVCCISVSISRCCHTRARRCTGRLTWFRFLTIHFYEHTCAHECECENECGTCARTPSPTSTRPGMTSGMPLLPKHASTLCMRRGGHPSAMCANSVDVRKRGCHSVWVFFFSCKSALSRSSRKPNVSGAILQY